MDKPQVEIETITPEIAGDWLLHNNSNRPLSATWVNEIAARMKRGEWHFNGDPIRFDNRMNLLDGQHRLSACIVARHAFRAVVIRELPAETFLTIDIGKRRGYADILAGRFASHYTTLAASLVWLFRFEAETLSTNLRPTPVQSQDCLERNPEIVASVDAICGWRTLAGPGALFAALHYRFAAVAGREAADLFWRRVADGLGLGAGDPRYVLRERLRESAISRAKLRHSDLAAMTVRAWNAWREGRSLRTLPVAQRLVADGRGAAYPGLPPIRS